MDLSSDYANRVNRAIDHIEAHLGEPLSVADAAAAACFSPYHFHRVFASFMGESVYAFIGRLRVERAAALLFLAWLLWRGSRVGRAVAAAIAAIGFLWGVGGAIAFRDTWSVVFGALNALILAGLYAPRSARAYYTRAGSHGSANAAGTIAA